LQIFRSYQTSTQYRMQFGVTVYPKIRNTDDTDSSNEHDFRILRTNEIQMNYSKIDFTIFKSAVFVIVLSSDLS